MTGPILWVATVILSGLLFRLFYERSAAIARWIVVQQCRLLPSEERLLREAEWLADMENVEGDAWKLVSALGIALYVAPRVLVRPQLSVSVAEVGARVLHRVAQTRVRTRRLPYIYVCAFGSGLATAWLLKLIYG